MKPLNEALHLAEPEGYLRLFCDEGPLMQQLLTRWQQQAAAALPQPIDPGMSSRQQLLAAYVGRLQTAFGAPAPTVTPDDFPHIHSTPNTAAPLHPVMSGGDTTQSRHQLAEPLTPRELDVLKLMATGLDNMGIADELTIAVSTVKTHVNHIFGKMAVRSRIQAVTRARDLQLIP
ncbi:MAG: hypothetical protein KDE53_30105 [Caldilineaceae bacterium]|nr:hypothetical protein [Caldilineaceae bacterium]